MFCHWLVDNRGDRPGTSGLEEAITFPDTKIVGRTSECLYDWKIGTPLPALFADCFNSKGAIVVDLLQWLRCWVPAGFRGHVVLDCEAWQWQRALVSAEQREALAAKFPNRSWTDMMTRFVHALALSLRMNWPGCTCGWYAGVTWHPDQFDRLTDELRADMVVDVTPPLSKLDAVHPVAYCNARENEFSPTYEQVRLSVDLRTGKKIIPIISAKRIDDTEWTDRPELLAQFAAFHHFGIHECMAWHAIESRVEALELQAWVNDVLTPALHEHNRYAR